MKSNKWGATSWLYLMLLALSPFYAQADNHPTLGNFSATYTLTGKGVTVGQIKLQLEKTSDNTYRYTGKTQPKGIAKFFTNETVDEISEGKVVAGQVIPDHYFYERKSKKASRKKLKNIRFNWDANKAEEAVASPSWSLPLSQGTQDLFSYQLAVMLGLAQNQDTLNLTVVDKGRFKEYQFKVIGTETITTPTGQFNSLKVSRTKKGKPSRYTIWVAPKLGYALVRIDRLDKDLRMDLKSIEGHPVILPAVTIATHAD